MPSAVQHVAIRLYASGKPRVAVAKLLGPHCYPHLPDELARSSMRRRLKQWEETQWFRDAVYEYAMIKTEMAIPAIMEGVRSRARRGRVDAARLVLEVTGRHNPRGEQAAPAVVQINFGGAVPRPATRQLEEPIEEAEWTED